MQEGDYMDKDIERRAYENLAIAIIIQAIKDYSIGYDKASVARFLRSEWCETLTGFDGNFIMDRIEKYEKEGRYITWK